MIHLAQDTFGNYPILPLDLTRGNDLALRKVRTWPRNLRRGAGVFD